MELMAALEDGDATAEVRDASADLIALKAVTHELGDGEVPDVLARFMDAELTRAERVESAVRPDSAEARELCETFFERWWSARSLLNPRAVEEAVSLPESSSEWIGRDDDVVLDLGTAFGTAIPLRINTTVFIPVRIKTREYQQGLGQSTEGHLEGRQGCGTFTRRNALLEYVVCGLHQGGDQRPIRLHAGRYKPRTYGAAGLLLVPFHLSAGPEMGTPIDHWPKRVIRCTSPRSGPTTRGRASRDSGGRQREPPRSRHRLGPPIRPSKSRDVAIAR
jgi:hypothetical protein